MDYDNDALLGPSSSYFGRASSALKYPERLANISSSSLLDSSRHRLNAVSSSLGPHQATSDPPPWSSSVATRNYYSSSSPPLNHSTLSTADKLLTGTSLSVMHNDLLTSSASTGLKTGGQIPPITTSGSAAVAGGVAATSASRAQSSLGHQLLQQLFDDIRQIEDTVDSIEIPARGRCRVFMAKYAYDPFKQSPNDNPDAELSFTAGDYILVFEDIDEDGYFIGELMDGRRGYVPSNWLDRLIGDDLLEFQASTLYNKQANAKDDESDAGGNSCYPPEFYDAMVNETMNHSNFQHLLAPEDYSRMNDYVDLDDVTEIDDECLSDYERAEAEQMRRAVPPPQRLVLEKQLNKSILISWLHPQAAKGSIVSYQVYVDGVLKSTVPSADRTKALLEGVDSSIPHRISVRAIDTSGRHSNDAGCTIVTSHNVPFAPSCVKASHITSDSALISWLPSNSNFHHVVAVNSVEVQTVRPGVYKHLINGLSANTLYRVWVRSKPGKILSLDEKTPTKLKSLTTYVDFKTQPKSLPDPPVNVQVEAGPQQRSLLVTWLPLTLNDFGSSNGCPVTGYAVFAGHKKLADIDSPTGDHALLDLADLESLHKKTVTVRTKSGENLSQDSMPCQIPDEYLKAGDGTSEHEKSLDAYSELRRARHSLAPKQLSDHQIRASGGRHGVEQASRNVRYQPQHGRLPQGAARFGSSAMARGRQMARSLQNFESDIDSRRSSIPQIEITKELSGSDVINPAESYSEEEFENSMRFRAGGMRNKQGSRLRFTRSRDGSAAGHADGSMPNLSKLHSLAGAKLKLGAGEPVRYFVALFDYEPSTMSPNPNAANEELAFKEGRVIKVYGDKGPDGFYRGELNGRVGYVPCNVVSEIADPSLYDKTKQLGYAGQQQAQRQAGLGPEVQQAATAVKRMIALYDYDPQENSPNADTDVSTIKRAQFRLPPRTLASRTNHAARSQRFRSELVTSFTCTAEWTPTASTSARSSGRSSAA